MRWNGQPGRWNVHATALHVRAGKRDCEGALDTRAVYLLCANGKGADARTQCVLSFTPSS